MNTNTGAKVVKAVSWILILYALIWGSAAYPPFDTPARILLDILAWPYGDGRPDWGENIMWMSSIGAGLLMAFGMLFLLVLTPAIARNDRQTVRNFVLAIIGWFVIDSIGSIASGFTANAVINAITLVPLLVPLLLIKWEA